MKKRLLAAGAGAAAAYAIAALAVAPGFFDGTCPAISYRWLSPPAGVKPTAAPASAHVEARLDRGPFFAATGDPTPQAQLSWLPNGWDASTGSVTVDMKPVNECPAPADARFVTNVYLVTASAKLVRDAALTLQPADNQPAPSTLYNAGADCVWKPVAGSQPDACGGVSARVTTLGHFAAGYATTGTASGPRRTGVGGPWLPIVVAAAIILVILAGVPLAMARRAPPQRGGGRANPPPRQPRRRPPAR